MWLPGFALEGEDVTFLVISEDLASGTATEYHTKVPSIFLTPYTALGDDEADRACQLNRFTVLSENNFSRSTTGVSEETILPTGIIVGWGGGGGGGGGDLIHSTPGYASDFNLISMYIRYITSGGYAQTDTFRTHILDNN